MANISSEEQLKQRIKDLESELADRERDLSMFRGELAEANGKLEVLIEKIEREINRAAEIQKYMVPTEFPNIPGFEFSSKFLPSPISGGDYYDIFEHEEKFRFGIVLASSSGYSMSALFLSVLLKITGQLEARRGKPARDLIEGLVNELRPQMNEEDSAHILYAVVDRRHFTLQASLVGELAVIHHSKSENKVRQIVSQSAPLGKEGEIEPLEDSVALNPRDRLIFCSIGILQAKNPKGEPFGLERLYQVILSKPGADVHDLRNEILFQVDKFTQQAKPIRRDQTMVVMEIKDRVIKLATSRD